mmetsp:Transcript_4697/g.19152  ORF Transcript_4697/g.19152 Transcript_4697/m.19152 type:complete len:87 (-) Transcript_4697:1692-1952(-)
MGIKGLFPFLQKVAPGAIEEKPQYLKHFVGRTLAIDSSLHLYQFLAAVRTGAGADHLANANGEATFSPQRLKEAPLFSSPRDPHCT